MQEAEDSHKYSDPEARVIHMKKLLERSLTARKRKLTHDGDSPEGQGGNSVLSCFLIAIFQLHVVTRGLLQLGRLAVEFHP